MQKIGAIAIITGMLIPWLVFISFETFSNEREISIINEKLRILEEVRLDVKTLLNRSK
jgi:hypothetical protein